MNLAYECIFTLLLFIFLVFVYFFVKKNNSIKKYGKDVYLLMYNTIAKESFTRNLIMLVNIIGIFILIYFITAIPFILICLLTVIFLFLFMALALEQSQLYDKFILFMTSYGEFLLLFLKYIPILIGIILILLLIRYIYIYNKYLKTVDSKYNEIKSIIENRKKQEQNVIINNKNIENINRGPNITKKEVFTPLNIFLFILIVILYIIKHLIFS